MKQMHLFFFWLLFKVLLKVFKNTYIASITNFNHKYKFLYKILMIINNNNHLYYLLTLYCIPSTLPGLYLSFNTNHLI